MKKDKKKFHYMVDLETLSTENNAAIVSIGACKFDMENKKILKKFYVKINFKDIFRTFRVIDADTLIWWLKQGDEARLELINEENSISNNEALKKFNDFLDEEEFYIWANGTDFDITILRSALKGYHDIKWKFYNVRDFRTVKSLVKDVLDYNKFMKIKINENDKVKHNALDDVIMQTEFLMEAYNLIRGELCMKN